MVELSKPHILTQILTFLWCSIQVFFHYWTSIKYDIQVSPYNFETNFLISKLWIFNSVLKVLENCRFGGCTVLPMMKPWRIAAFFFQILFCCPKQTGWLMDNLHPYPNLLMKSAFQTKAKQLRFSCHPIQFWTIFIPLRSNWSNFGSHLNPNWTSWTL